MENVPAALGGRFVREESESAYSASCVPTASITTTRTIIICVLRATRPV